MSNANKRVGPEFFKIIGRFERGKANDPNCRLTSWGAALDAYLCPANVPTIGNGSTKRLDGTPVEMGDTITEAEVFLLAERDAEEAASAVRKIKRPLEQHQFDALTAFTHNLGEGNLRKIAPLIEEGRWEDAAEKMSEYVRAWGIYNDKWHFMALLGLRVRRFAEGLLLNGYEWSGVCDPEDIGMPKKRPPEWQPDGIAKDGSKGRYFDVLLPGATEYTTLEASAPRLASLTKAEPAPSVAPASAGQPVSDPQPQTPAALPSPVKEPAKTSPDAAVASKISPNVDTKPVAPSVSGSGAAGPVAAPSAPQVPQKPLPVPSSTKPVDTKPPAPPVPMPPSVQVSTQNDMGPTTKSMYRSKRFWGGALIILGRLIIALDVSGNFSPAIRGLIGDGVLMDWMTGIIVTMVGEMVLDRGEKKAEGPIDTPKRVALMTPAP